VDISREEKQIPLLKKNTIQMILEANLFRETGQGKLQKETDQVSCNLHISSLSFFYLKLSWENIFRLRAAMMQIVKKRDERTFLGFA
jgi:hypothetical protein